VDDQFASSECDVQQTPISPVEQTNSVEDSNQMDVQNFMPVKKVLSEKEQMKHDEDEQSTYRMHEESHIQVIPLKVPLHIPYDLMAYCHYTGDVSSFSPATRDDSNKLGESQFVSVVLGHLLSTLFLRATTSVLSWIGLAVAEFLSSLCVLLWQ
jgi:hypothetical protein